MSQLSTTCCGLSATPLCCCLIDISFDLTACVTVCDGSSETHHTRLRDRVGYEDQEDAEHSSNLDGEAARLALKTKDTELGELFNTPR